MSLTPPVTRSLTREVTRSLIRATGGGGASDPFFDNVVLLLDFAGADEAQAATDLSNSPHVITFSSDAELDADLPFIGENSLLLPGFDELTAPNHADWDFGTGDFCIEFGARWAAETIPGDVVISGSVPSTNPGWYIYATGTTLRLTVNNGILTQENHGMTGQTWYHLAVCRIGTDLRMFVDGVQIGSGVTDSTNILQSSGVLMIGALQEHNAAMDGNIGALRITKGAGRYAENFTPPTEFYPRS